ncbi:MAG: S8 family peptidase [Bacteroidetes bacterium]|nr:S8 family peptidase [Bacteroidota bacterium]
MKNALLLLALCYAILASAQTTGKAYAKLSPRTQIYLDAIRRGDSKSAIQHDYVYKRTTQGICISALIRVTPTISEADLEALGVHVGTRAGLIWTAQVPLVNVEAFTQLPGIDYIQLDEPVSMTLDSARRTTRVDSVHAGIGLPHPYTGKGVVVGIVDVGFDYTHPTVYDTSGTNYRISRVWEMKTPGIPPSGFNYGNEMTDSFTIQSQQTDNPGATHGTHVMGIAAGSGFGSTDTSSALYRGMAFESELVLVGIMPDSNQWQGTGMSDFLDGINYVFTYAASVGKPAVVNLSWGTPVGPRDGTSLFSEGCDALTGAGKIFVVAAGNEGESAIHLQKTFSATDTVVKTFATFDPYLNVKKLWLDFWGDPGKTFCLQVSLHHGTEIASTGYVCLDNNLHSFSLPGTNHDSLHVQIVTSTSEFNGKPRIYLTLYNRATTDSVLLSVRSTDGRVDCWDGYVTNGEGYGGPLSSYGYPWATQGDTNYVTSDIVSTRSAISAGAYSAKVEYTSISHHSYNFLGYTTLGALVPFSSHGPTTDGRIVPDITAPGLCVVSSVNSFCADVRPGGVDYVDVVSSWLDLSQNRQYYWAQFSGTSMATPCTSGIIALMLEANPGLYPDQIKRILTQTAILDTFTGTLPASGLNTWGHGKINAYGAVIAASLSTGVGEVPGNTLSVSLYPNPGNGLYTLSYQAAREAALTVDVYDISGRLVYNTEWNTTADKNTTTIDLSKNSAGMYMVRVASGDHQSMIKVAVGK